MTSASWKKRLLILVLIILGSIAILFPAWIPEDARVVTEDSAVEGLQWVLLLTAAAFWLGAARSAFKTGPFYRIMAALCLAGAFGEGDRLFEELFHIQVDYIFAVLALYVVVSFHRNRRRFPLFFTEITSQAAAGFFASALMMIYVLARALGSPLLWQATLGKRYHRDIPDTVQGYVELLACYLLLIGTLGICLRPRKHDFTAGEQL